MPDRKHAPIADLTDTPWSGAPVTYYAIAGSGNDARAIAFAHHLGVTRTRLVSTDPTALKSGLVFMVKLGSKRDRHGKEVPFSLAEVYVPAPSSTDQEA